MSCYRTAVMGLFAGRTLAQMATQAAADEVAELLNVTMAGSSIARRRVARRLITGTMDAAARAEKTGRHKLSGIRLAEGTRAPAAPGDDEDDDEEAGGFVFITDDQVRQLADGITVTGEAGRKRTLQGVGIAAWLQRTMGLRIREALGTEKADFRTRKNGERYLRLRSQASRDGRTRVPRLPADHQRGASLHAGYFSDVRNLAHTDGVNARRGPSGSLLSRTATPRQPDAASTQLPFWAL
jgi:hypothetical protein